MSLPLPNRTNQDYVAEAVAAIPHWLAFLDEMEAEQDALIAEMRAQRQAAQGASETLERGSVGPLEQRQTEGPLDPATPGGADEEPVVRSSAPALQRSNASAQTAPPEPESEPASHARTEYKLASPEGQAVAVVVAETPVLPPADNSGNDEGSPAICDPATPAPKRTWSGQLRERGDA